MIELKEIDAVRKSGFRPNVVALIINKYQKVLLGYKEEYNIWEFCQGGIKNSEMLSDALGREIKEELRVEISNLNIGLHNKVFMESRINFPPQSQGARELGTDNGKSITMKGKHYYFMLLHLYSRNEQDDFLCSKSEYDEIKWAGYQKAKELNRTNQQKGKRRIINEALSKLYTDRQII